MMVIPSIKIATSAFVQMTVPFVRSGGVAHEGDEHALDDEFPGGDEVGEVGVFGTQEGLAVFDHVALEGGFAVDEGSDDVAFPRFAAFEDHGVAMADVGVDHGLAADFEGKGFGVAGDAKGGDVNADAPFARCFDVLGHAGGDIAVEWDVGDFAAVEFIGENDGAGLAGDPLDDAFAFERAQVAHGGGLAGEAKEVLDLAGGWHDAGLPLGLFEVVEDFLLAEGE